MKKLTKQDLPFFIFLMIFFQGVYHLKQNYALAISSTPSLPDTVFLIDKKNKHINKNDYVSFYYPGEDFAVYKTGDEFVKIAKCIPGDQLHVVNKNYFCNDQLIATGLLKDSRGQDMSSFEFNGTVPQGKYFVIGTHKKSFDSRYWGFVDQKEIIGLTKGLI